MKMNSVLVFVFFVASLLGVQTALAQFNIPKSIQDIPQILDAMKGKRDQPIQAAPTQAPPTAGESRPADSQTMKRQPAPRLTMDDPHFSALSSLAGGIGLYQDEKTAAWLVGDNDANIDGAKCMKTLNELAAAGVPESRAIEVHYSTPDFSRGVRTLAEIRKSCELVERLGKIKHFERWAISAKEDADAGRVGQTVKLTLERCVSAYDDIIKAGIAPTDRVPERSTRAGMWSGTVGEIHQKWCNAGLSQATANVAANEAPYRKVLQNDKLKMVINSPPGHIRTYAVPGGEYSADANKLAAASVWFDNASAPSNEIQVCPSGGKRLFLRRYTFDAQHNLLNNTSREYCGNIPAAAYR